MGLPMVEQKEKTMKTKLDIRRIVIFCGFAFGIAWLTGLVIFLKGGLVTSPEVFPGVSLALVLLATAYMWAPALGNILTRLLTREGWSDTYLRPNFKRGWLFWLAGWFLPAIMTLAGAAIFFALFPRYFDPSLSTVKQSISQSPSMGSLSPWAVVAIQLILAVLVAPVLNFLATFGEEFGWRAYLFPKLMPLGGRMAMLIIGVIWGIWHWPVILMGYEYGFKYPGFPWTGLLLFIVITYSFATFLGWLTLRSRSVWPAVVGHAAINGIAGVAALVTIGQPNPLLGPLPVGIIGSLGFVLVALALMISPTALRNEDDRL